MVRLVRVAANNACNLDANHFDGFALLCGHMQHILLLKIRFEVLRDAGNVSIVAVGFLAFIKDAQRLSSSIM